MNDIQKLNEEIIYTLHTIMPINEMAKLTGGIEVHNEDDNSKDKDELKFAHFHWNQVHFKLSRKIPKNATQLKKMIAFTKEQDKLDDHQLTQLCKILRSKPLKPVKTKFKTVYEQIIEVWETLNDREVDYID